MTKLFYPRLAAANIKKHAKIYIPYIVAAAFTVMMYYIISSLSRDEGLSVMSGGEDLQMILSLGSYVVAVIAVMVLLYVNSFIMKRRTKEFGLFNVLGMEKRHIAIVAGWEVLYTGLISILGGILLGIVLSKAMQLLLGKLVNLSVSFGFNISVEAIISVVILFTSVFAFTLIYNIVRVYRSKPTELLSSANVGEREPRTKWVMTILGVACLGVGYYIALTIESPLDALTLFFIAVLLVIAGTYLLFTAVSITLLKALRHNKKYYYKAKHFVSVSGMLYRMKQNAAGLATICILATAVLIMISTTVSLYTGFEDSLRTRYPRNISLSVKDITDKSVTMIDSIVSDTLSSHDAHRINEVNFKYISAVVLDNNGVFTGADNIYNTSDAVVLYFIPLEEYNRLENQSAVLASDEVLLCGSNGEATGYDTIAFGEMQCRVAGESIFESIDAIEDSLLDIDTYYVIMPDEQSILSACNRIDTEDPEISHLDYYCGFDLGVDADTQIAITDELVSRVGETGMHFTVTGAESGRASFYILYGGLLFLGVFLGVIFTLYTVLIIYYKQISEGYDDRERFVIMQKVGMSRDMVKTTIGSQVVMVFFLPLLVAAIHVAAAFRIITKLLQIFYLSNVALFAICTVCTLVVFAVLYGIVYLLTAREYYKIVRVS